jgi:hypothetical protein
MPVRQESPLPLAKSTRASRAAKNPPPHIKIHAPPAVKPVEVLAGENQVDRGSNIGTGPQVGFPLKLQRILDKLEADGNTDIISWLPHGRAFLVKNSNRFVSEVMPVYFNQSKYSSFQRQLHMYNFQRINYHTRDKGAYHHPSFLRGHPQLAMQMKRTRVNGKGTRRPGNPGLEPDFWTMEPVAGISLGESIDIPISSSRDDDDVGEDDTASTTEEE